MAHPDFQTAFDLVNLRQLMDEVRKLPQQSAQEIWRRAQEIMAEAQGERDEETRIYNLHYRERIDAQKNIIRDEDKPPRRDFEPYGYRGAKFDEHMVTRNAKARVELSHCMRVIDIDRKELAELAALRKLARKMLKLHGAARTEFSSVSRKRGPRRGLRRSWSED